MSRCCAQTHTGRFTCKFFYCFYSECCSNPNPLAINVVAANVNHEKFYLLCTSNFRTLKRIRCLCRDCCSRTLANCSWRQTCGLKLAEVVWITDLKLTNLALKEHSIKCAQALLNFNACFPCQGTILPWKSWKYLWSNTRWCIKAYVCRGTCSFPVSGSSGVLVLQRKTTEFPKTILFWESCGWASVFVPVCILKIGHF